MAASMKSSKASVLFDVLNYILMIILCISILYPFLYLITLSLSSGNISFTKIRIIPYDISLANYAQVLSSRSIVSGFYNSIMRTIVGTMATMFATLFAAYPLSKKYFPHRKFWTGFIVFTMFFSGGLIPSYLLIKSLGLMNTRSALILPGLISAYNMTIVRNYFMSLPESLEESARIDGANDVVILFKIIVPISVPIIATVGLWTAVGHWNAWFDAMIYITDSRKQVLQVVLRRITLEGRQELLDLSGGVEDTASLSPETIKAAVTMVTIVPIIMVYPFIQKYFVKGIMIGSLKG